MMRQTLCERGRGQLGLKVVEAASNATLTNSTVLRGRIPLVQGAVVTFMQVSAQAGSH